ncbi:Interactor of constitutive active ROPs 2, chloroplastic [Linum grandiflorum]
MQTPKAKAVSSDAPTRRSPAGTPRTVRQLKVPGADSDSVSSPNHASKTPKDRSPKVPERKSPRSPITEQKKRPGKVAELESQLAQLQEELKKTKDQLNASESCKRQAQQEAEDTKKQLISMSSKVEECQQQLMELTASDDTRVEELTKISHDRDRAWQSELEAVHKQHSMDSAALANAMNEIHRLKNQLQLVVAESEAAQSKHAESAQEDLQALRMELSDCRKSEAEALDAVSKAHKQLETSNASAEKLRFDGIQAVEACDRLELELEQSKAQVKSLEELVSKLQADSESPLESTPNEEETNQLKSLKAEVCQLRADLEASEARYQEEYIQSTLQIRGAYEQVEQTKQESMEREAEMEAELKNARAYIDELKTILMEKETNSEKDEGLLSSKIEETHPSELETDLKKLECEFTELKASLLEKETKLQGLAEQNEMLKMEVKKGEEERSNAEAAKAAEREALMKLGYITEEADKSSRRAARVTEQLDASQAANTEMEAELRRLKVQADQWRKAAEAAASILSSTGNNNGNGKFVERTGSLDNNVNYTTIAGAMVGSPFSEDMDDESLKKKNGNVLKKIGVLWKKGQK